MYRIFVSNSHKAFSFYNVTHDVYSTSYEVPLECFRALFRLAKHIIILLIVTCTAESHLRSL